MQCKPSPVEKRGNNSIVKQTFSQMWCMLRLNHILFGYLFETSEHVCSMYLSFMHLVQILCSPIQNHETISEMKKAVSIFLHAHCLFNIIWTLSNLNLNKEPKSEKLKNEKLMNINFKYQQKLLFGDDTKTRQSNDIKNHEQPSSQSKETSQSPL